VLVCGLILGWRQCGQVHLDNDHGPSPISGAGPAPHEEIARSTKSGLRQLMTATHQPARPEAGEARRIHQSKRPLRADAWQQAVCGSLPLLMQCPLELTVDTPAAVTQLAGVIFAQQPEGHSN
tara:strand:- start:181884 stop:182252 length:369 start_codon:yes stop_codon:yes gene_type:complete